MIEFLAGQIPGILLGAIAGALIMFFVAQKNPKWVQEIYQKQRSVSMQGTEKVAELEAKVRELELAKMVEEKVKEALAKVKQ